MTYCVRVLVKKKQMSHTHRVLYGPFTICSGLIEIKWYWKKFDPARFCWCCSSPYLSHLLHAFLSALLLLLLFAGFVIIVAVALVLAARWNNTFRYGPYLLRCCFVVLFLLSLWSVCVRMAETTAEPIHSTHMIIGSSGRNSSITTNNNACARAQHTIITSSSNFMCSYLRFSIIVINLRFVCHYSAEHRSVRTRRVHIYAIPISRAHTNSNRET